MPRTMPITTIQLILTANVCAAFLAPTSTLVRPVLRLRGGDLSPLLTWHNQILDKTVSTFGREGEPAGLIRVGLFALLGYGWPY